MMLGGRFLLYLQRSTWHGVVAPIWDVPSDSSEACPSRVRVVVPDSYSESAVEFGNLPSFTRTVVCGRCGVETCKLALS